MYNFLDSSFSAFRHSAYIKNCCIHMCRLTQLLPVGVCYSLQSCTASLKPQQKFTISSNSQIAFSVNFRVIFSKFSCISVLKGIRITWLHVISRVTYNSCLGEVIIFSKLKIIQDFWEWQAPWLPGYKIIKGTIKCWTDHSAIVNSPCAAQLPIKLRIKQML